MKLMIWQEEMEEFKKWLAGAPFTILEIVSIEDTQIVKLELNKLDFKKDYVKREDEDSKSQNNITNKRNC
jgi:hypothetical protein